MASMDPGIGAGAGAKEAGGSSLGRSAGEGTLTESCRRGATCRKWDGSPGSLATGPASPATITHPHSAANMCL